MNSIREIRPALERIPNCLSSEAPKDLPPEATDIGDFPSAPLFDVPTNNLGEDPTDGPAPLDSTLDPEEILEILGEIDLDAAQQAVSGTLGRDFKAAIQVRSVDALAWYVSFHYTQTQWGIYIPTSSLVYLAVDRFLPLGTCTSDQALLLAFRMLHRHELFHFAVDYFAAQVEVLIEQPCYLPARILKARLGYNPLEEGLAHAYMLRSLYNAPNRIKNVKGKADAMREMVDQAPPGYRDGARMKSSSVFKRQTSNLVSEYIQCAPGWQGRGFAGLNGYDLLPSFPDFPWRHCPLHIIHDGQRVGATPSLLFRSDVIEPITETKTFQKMLRRLTADVQRRWPQTKSKLSMNAQARSLNVRRWQKDDSRAYPKVFTVNVDGSHRVHLGHNSTGWHALRIGDHRTMGH